MEVLMFVFGGLCFAAVVLVCGAYYTKRLEEQWKSEEAQWQKRVDDAVFALHVAQSENKKLKELYNAQSKNEERES